MTKLFKDFSLLIASLLICIMNARVVVVVTV